MKKGIERRYILLWGLLIFIIPFIIYSNSFNNEFLAGDDEEIVLRNVYLRSWKYVPNLFTEQYKAGAGGVADFWRPFQLLTYTLIVNTIGIKPWPFHFASILFHSLCGLFLYLIFLELFPKKIPLSIIAIFALLWVVHPIHNEEMAVTTGIASSTHLFWMLSGLFTFILFEKRKNRAWIVLSLLSFALSLCSKESGIVFPGLLLGMHITGIKAGVFEKTKISKFICKHISFWILAFLYVIARLTVLNFQNTLNFYTESNIFTENFSFRLYTLFTVLTHGLRIMFLPIGLHPERSWPVFTTLFSVNVFSSFLIVASIFALAIILWRKNPLFTFGIFWFLFSYFPMSNLVAKINALIWDHWFYTPSVGIFLSIASLMERKIVQKAAFFVAIPAIIIFSAVTIYRNPFFRNTESISRYILYYEPQTIKTWNNLGMALAEKGNHQEAINCYKKSIGLADVYPQTHHNLGNAYLKLEKYELAEREFLKAVSIDSNFYHSYLWLGELYRAQGRTEKAVECYRKALDIYPHLPRVREFLSKVEQ